MTEATVVVVGSVNVDLVVRAARLPGPGETVTGGAFARHGGGKGANQAVAAARAGAHVRMIAAVGDDELGRAARDELADAGIDVRGLATVPGVATGVALIVVDGTGENQIAVASGANGELRAGHVAHALAGSADGGSWVCLLDLEVPDEPLVEAARITAAAGRTLLINPAPARAIAAGLLEAGPILTPNAREAQLLSGRADPQQAAKALHERTGAPVLVTLGAEGVLLLDERGVRHLPGFPATAVDTTGAGDAFSGVLAAGLAQGRRLDEAVERAQAAAAISVTVPGARSGMPDAVAIEAFLSTTR